MKRLFSKMFSRSKSGALSFAAKSTLMGFGSLAATGAFAGGSPSHITWIKNFHAEVFAAEQLKIVNSLVIQRLESPEITEDERSELQEILLKLNQAGSSNETVSIEKE